jgi:hypothetical protein
MKRSVVFLSVWAMALAGVLGGLVPASASAQSPASAVAAAAPVSGVPVTLGGADPSSLVINVTSTHDPSYALNRQLAFDSANSTTRLPILRDTEIVASADTGLPYGQFSFDLYAPAGQKLHVGKYTGVHDTLGHDPDYAGLRVTLGSSSETVQDSEVEISDLATDASGTVTRLDLVFRLNPARPANSWFGSIRFGQAETPGRTLSAHVISWPMSPVGAPRVLATESLHNTGTAPLNVGPVAVTGVNSADFTLTDDSCSGHTLLPGQACPLVIGFTPTGAGQRSATLSLPINGETDTVELGGEAPPGFSRIVTSGNDYVSNGLVHNYVDGPYQLEVKGNRQRLMFAPTKVYDYQFDGLSVWLRGSGNQPMTIGMHPAEDYFARSQTAYGIHVSGLGRGCETKGSINVKQLTYAPDGTLLTADIAFTQNCSTDSPADVMKGEIKWRLPLTDLKHATWAYVASSRSGRAVYINALVHEATSNGMVSPGGRTVYLQRYLNGTWQNMLARTTNSAGHITVGFIQTKVYQYRVLATETSSAWGAYSGSTFR